MTSITSVTRAQRALRQSAFVIDRPASGGALGANTTWPGMFRRFSRASASIMRHSRSVFRDFRAMRVGKGASNWMQKFSSPCSLARQRAGIHLEEANEIRQVDIIFHNPIIIIILSGRTDNYCAFGLAQSAWEPAPEVGRLRPSERVGLSGPLVARRSKKRKST